jgi:hypothetical protein
MIDWLEKEKGVEVTMINCGVLTIYNAYLPGNTHADRLPKKVEDVYKEISE